MFTKKFDWSMFNKLRNWASLNKKIDWNRKNVIDQFEVNYEVAEKVMLDIKRKVDNELDINPHATELDYCIYEPITYEDIKYIETHLPNRYSIEIALFGYCYSTDIFENSATTLKLCYNEEKESSLDDYWDEEGKIK